MPLALLCLAIYITAGLSASIFYHRILTHRQAILAKWVFPVFVIMALPLGTPIQWVGTHRQHHQHTDRPGDPHSPVLFGFWYAHCGWYIQNHNKWVCMLYSMAGPIRMFIDGYRRPRTNQEYVHLAIDIQQSEFCAWVSKPQVYQYLLWIYASVLLAAPYLLFGTSGVIATWLMLIAVYTLGDGVNSIGHSPAPSNKTYHQARNLPLFSWVSFGEGWHANHHDDASRSDISMGQGKDIGYLCLSIMVMLRLAKWNPHLVQA
jgi:fatty-acid desaturase